MNGGAPALSPDGTKIAFVVEDSAGRSLWVQSLDAFDAKSLTGTQGAAAPFWSPGGDELAFVAEGSLKTVKLDGGAPRVLATGVQFTSQGALPGAWNGDGTLLFLHLDNTLWRVSSKGGEATPATERNAAAMEQDHYGAVFLPDGRHVILLVRRGPELRLEVVLGELGSNSRKPLLSDVTNAQYAPGRNGRSSHLIFARGRRLIARPFNDDQLELTGSEVTLAEDVAVTVSAHSPLTQLRGMGARTGHTSSASSSSVVPHLAGGEVVHPFMRALDGTVRAGRTIRIRRRSRAVYGTALRSGHLSQRADSSSLTTSYSLAVHS